ncbi:hypothetical protein ROJ8625_00053 [Roseivivax jejudonensis]|uniref:Uncharacterized protein n=1 Tax=Roseivivax jejudonensis TaxID=1529041 RepID=A0A1X6Y398_9RHOB|nr:hypothetical protein [Roseivivax jejudonensis]SLN09680.1 hypothetical protein ROJ8625_00053 [Roseivivax jejudonensis]
MGKILIGCVGLCAGAVIGAIFGGAVLGGATTGIGIATGLSAGICSTVIAAEEEGLLTADEIDQVLNRAAADASEMAGTDTAAPVVGSLDECSQVMDRMRAAAAE